MGGSVTPVGPTPYLEAIMATPARKTAAKKAESSTKSDGVQTTTKPDTGEVVPTDPNDSPTPDTHKVPEPDLKVEIVQPVEVIDEKIESDVEDVDFVYVHHLDPARRLPGGTYLDEVQRYEAEAARAMTEDREPDLENAPAVQGTPLKSLDVLVQELPPVFTGAEDITKVTLPVVVTK